MKTRTDWPSRAVDAAIASALVLVVAICGVALLKNTTGDLQPGLKSSSDQTIVPTAEPQSQITLR